MNDKLKESPLSFLHANYDLLYKHTTKFDLILPEFLFIDANNGILWHYWINSVILNNLAFEKMQRNFRHELNIITARSSSEGDVQILC